MRTQVTSLLYWKSEHGQEACEDAAGADTAQGLFAVADGAGTTLFADIWAHFLVNHFLLVPLLSDDPFEVEWWTRMAQEKFKQDFPVDRQMSWNALQKYQNEGSHTTLATLRVAATKANGAQAILLVFGDSCVFVSRDAAENLVTFPLAQIEHFARPPICVPSKPIIFNRNFHRCQMMTVDLSVNDRVILATDAVAKWIVSAGRGRYTAQHEAMQAILRQNTNSWPAFIQECRARGEMEDDDCTALVINFLADLTEEGEPTGITATHTALVRKKRKLDFLQALQGQNKELSAIYFGDGRDLEVEGIEYPQEQRLNARKVADALSSVLALLRQESNNPFLVDIMTSTWQKYALLLHKEPSAASLQTTLLQLGVPLEPHEPLALADEREISPEARLESEMDKRETTKLPPSANNEAQFLKIKEREGIEHA